MRTRSLTTSVILCLLLLFTATTQAQTEEANAFSSAFNEGDILSQDGGAKIGAIPKDAAIISMSQDTSLPSSFDWRDVDGVDWMTPIKVQRYGSCWAFGPIAAMETAIKIQTNNSTLDIDLSEQYLVSACCDAGDNGGGYPYEALKFMEGGVPLEEEFPYTGKNSACTPFPGWNEKSWGVVDVVIIDNTIENIKRALMEYGPLPVVLNCEDLSTEPTASSVILNSEEDPIIISGNHAVALVGYDDSKRHWIVKCSKRGSSCGGEAGYKTVSYGNIEKHNYIQAITGVYNNANQPPIAEVSASPTSGTAPLTVVFTGTGTDSDGAVVSYEWTFGDSESSISQNPIHIYDDPGTYTATLTVTDDDGATGSDSIEIKVAECTGLWVSPVAAVVSSFCHDRYAPRLAIDGYTETHWFSKENDGSPWIQLDMGRRKAVSGVRMMVTGSDVPMTLDVQTSNDASTWTTVVSGFTITEGKTFTEIMFAQTEARYVRLLETSLNREYGTCTEVNVYVILKAVNQPPIVFASADPAIGEAPFEVAFTGTGTDSDGAVVSYEWTFGDSESSISQNPIHIYDDPGTYTATLTVTDDDGATGSDSITVVVTNATGWISPVTAFASSWCCNSCFPVKAIDDNNRTYWYAQVNDGPPSWIRFDLGTVKSISKVRVMVSRFEVPMTVNIQVSNDTSKWPPLSTWTTVVSDLTITEGNIFVEIPFTEIDARHVKLLETAYPHPYGQCTEFDVWVGN